MTDPQSHLPATGDWRPVPDPTALTTAAVEQSTEAFRRDLSALRELIDTRLRAMDKATELLAATVGKVPSDTDKAVAALKDLLGARIDGMDTATRLLASNLSAIPTETDKRIGALRVILEGEIRNVRDTSLEKFTAIEGTFASNALALTAALAAQKEAAAEQNKSNTLAINKSEQATKEASAANVAQTSTSLSSQLAQITDLKERLVRLESGGLALAAARSEQREDRGDTRGERAGFNQVLAMAITSIAVIAAIVFGIIAAVKH